MERYGIVRDGFLLWVECPAEAARIIKRYGGRMVCEPDVVQASDELRRSVAASASPDAIPTYAA